MSGRNWTRKSIEEMARVVFNEEIKNASPSPNQDNFAIIPYFAPTQFDMRKPWTGGSEPRRGIMLPNNKNVTSANQVDQIMYVTIPEGIGEIRTTAIFPRFFSTEYDYNLAHIHLTNFGFVPLKGDYNYDNIMIPMLFALEGSISMGSGGYTSTPNGVHFWYYIEGDNIYVYQGTSTNIEQYDGWVEAQDGNTPVDPDEDYYVRNYLTNYVAYVGLRSIHLERGCSTVVNDFLKRRTNENTILQCMLTNYGSGFDYSNIVKWEKSFPNKTLNVINL